MVLVYEEEDFGVMTLAEVTRREVRKVFQENLVKEGLELELEEKHVSVIFVFTHIHHSINPLWVLTHRM
jgi:hypothetical protein